MGKQYKIFTNTTGSNNGVASLKITRKARVRCIYAQLDGLGGAGAGRMVYEVSKQNVSSLNTSDTPETVLASFGVGFATGAAGVENAFVPCDLEVDVGDTIYLNTALTGTAPAGAQAQFYLYT